MIIDKIIDLNDRLRYGRAENAQFQAADDPFRADRTAVHVAAAAGRGGQMGRSAGPLHAVAAKQNVAQIRGRRRVPQHGGPVRRLQRFPHVQRHQLAPVGPFQDQSVRSRDPVTGVATVGLDGGEQFRWQRSVQRVAEQAEQV